MPVYSEKLKGKWKEAFESYERICGFEPMYQEDIDSGTMTIQEAWWGNIEWLEDVLAEVTNISIPYE